MCGHTDANGGELGVEQYRQDCGGGSIILRPARLLSTKGTTPDDAMVFEKWLWIVKNNQRQGFPGPRV